MRRSLRILIDIRQRGIGISPMVAVERNHQLNWLKLELKAS